MDRDFVFLVGLFLVLDSVAEGIINSAHSDLGEAAVVLVRIFLPRFDWLPPILVGEESQIDFY